uniref:Uncharacterized protein n=1 Tax=Chenopodium quinoa TaxID=63459 RepID=A0A803LC02_CHEQI
METETLDISATNFNSSWPIIHGSLEDAITSESSISSVDSVPALKPPLILRLSFTQQHEIKQVYVRSTARVYEIYYSANEKGENEYLCTVRCGVAAKSEELLQETDGVGSLPISSCSPNSSSCDGHLRSDSGGSTNEDDWVDVKVRNSAMLDEGTPLSKIDESCMERGNQDYFEATAEISDADPFLSITLRLLSIQSGDCIYIDEVYVFADPVVSIDTNSSTNAPESSSESAKMSLLIPTLLSLSNIRRNQMQEQSDSAVGERKHQDTGVKSTSTFVSSNTSQSESIQGTTLNSAPVHMSQPEFPMQKPDSQMNPHSNSERNELSCSRIEKTLDELVSRVAKIEDFFLRFEEKMVKPISNMEGRLERVEQQLELFAKTVGSVKACNRISAPDFSGIDSESKSIFNEGNGSPSTTNSESIKKDESRPPDMSIPSSDVYSSPSVLPNNMSSSSSNAAPLIPSLVVTAPDFSCVDDEGESDACEAVKDSPKGNLKKPLSINDALASALAGFLSSASKDTDVVEETAYISSKEENGSPCPSESSDSILSDEHVVSSVDVDWYNISTKDDIVLTEKEFFNAGKGFEETTESVELQNCVIEEGKSEKSLDISVLNEVILENLDVVKTDIDDSRLDRFGEADDDSNRTFIFGSTDSPAIDSSTAASGVPAAIIDSCSGEEMARECPGMLLNILKLQSPAVVDFGTPILDVKFLSQEKLSATSSFDALLMDVPDVCSEVPCVDEDNATFFNGQHDLVMIEDGDSAISETPNNEFCLDDYNFDCILSNREGLQECGIQDMGESLI